MDPDINISFIDKSFDSNNISQYHLSLQVYLKGFSFALLDRERNKFIALHHQPFQKISSIKILNELLEQNITQIPLLKNNFSHVKAIFATPKFTYIPSPFFDKTNVRQIFAFNHDLSNNEVIETNYIYGNSAYVAFAIPLVIKQTLDNYFENIKYYHQTSPLIEEILLKSKIQTIDKAIYINTYPDFFDLAFIENGTLNLINTYSYNSITDFLYFILNTYDQLKLQPNTVPVFISGIIAKDCGHINKLKQFVKNVNYLDKPSHFDYSYGFTPYNDHYFTNMLNLYQCG